MLSNFKGKKILIFGLGLNQGGVGSAKFFASHGALVRVTDLKDEQILEPSINQLKEFKDIEYGLGEHSFEDIDWADLIIKNPSVKPENKYIEYAKIKGKQVEIDMGIFLQFVNPKQVIGVTGTKGKSTTASLIYEVLKNSQGVNVIHPPGVLASHLWKTNIIFAGNIGKSVLDTIEYIKNSTLVILEISSFQLESFDIHKVSPHIAVTTNLFPEHLNYYKDFREYTEAKKAIAKYQTKDDLLLINKNDPIINSKEFLNGLQAKITYFSSSDLPKSFKPILLGEHNRTNYAAALAVAKQLGIKEGVALKNMNKFKGAPFRLQFIKKYKGFKIYNDSAATNPDATIAALKALSEKQLKKPNIILICGGMNKNLDYVELAKTINKYAKAVFLIEGDATDAVISSLRDQQSNLKINGPYNNLPHILKNVREVARKGDIILFSPGATSFNLFQNEFDRGRKFNQAIDKVFTNI